MQQYHPRRLHADVYLLLKTFGRVRGRYKLIHISNSCFVNEMIHVEVGKSQNMEKFTVHKGLLCHHSQYFRAALQGGPFVEALLGVVKLDDQDPKTFKHFVYWLYTQDICEEKKAKSWSTKLNERTAITLNQAELIDLWIFGDRVVTPGLQNAAINALHRHILESWTIPAWYITSTYERTITASKLRAFVIESILMTNEEASRCSSPAVDFATLPSDFFREIITRLHKASIEGGYGIDQQLAWATVDLCQFHIHDKDTRCEK